jgi:DNA-binding XRE family transcriptional regulator
MDTTEIDRKFEVLEWLASGHARHLRVDAGVTQAEMGRALGVDSRTILNWETGRWRPQPKFIAPYRALLLKLETRAAAMRATN